MPPLLVNDTTRARMRRQLRRNTKPELRLRRALHARGLRFRVSVGALPGSPDVVFTRAKIAVFVDGCYWHKCPLHGTDPKHNADWWQAKLQSNVERDQRQSAELEAAGWAVQRFWEHEDPQAVADTVEALWRKRIRDSRVSLRTALRRDRMDRPTGTL